MLGAAHEPLEVPAVFLLMAAGARSRAGRRGRSIDSEDTHGASAPCTGVRSMNELLPLERAAEAYDRMMSGKARFRVVLTTGQ